jgi:hypothetical protein
MSCTQWSRKWRRYIGKDNDDVKIPATFSVGPLGGDRRKGRKIQGDLHAGRRGQEGEENLMSIYKYTG